MSKLFTKAQIAKLYNVQPRTVSNWLSRARAEKGDGFPGNYEGSALVFTDDQVEELVKFSGDAERKIAQPKAEVMPPDAIADGESTALASRTVIKSQPIIHVHVHQPKVALIHRDTTGLEAATARYESLSAINATQFVQGFGAYGASGAQEIQAQVDQVLALAQVKALEEANLQINGVQ
jgi:hypothetical protein